jgi:8-oxo-dGTP pyrophosphatase MutT (NUDIX family)
MLRRPPRQQYAALCYRLKKKQPVLEILVVTSRDTGRWIIPKGWPMPGKKAHAVAEREAYEEAGVKGKAHKEAFGSYGYQKNLASGISVACRVQVHLLEVDDLLRNFPEKASRTLEWVSCQEAISRVREPELKSLIATFEKQMTPVRPLVEKKAAAG